MSERKRHTYTLLAHGHKFDILCDGVAVMVDLLQADVDRNRRVIERAGGTLS